MGLHYFMDKKKPRLNHQNEITLVWNREWNYFAVYSEAEKMFLLADGRVDKQDVLATNLFVRMNGSMACVTRRVINVQNVRIVSFFH